MKRISQIAARVIACTLIASISLAWGQFTLAQNNEASQSANKPASPDSIFQRMKAVSAKSKTVSSAKGYSEVIAECDALLAEELNKPSHRDYLKKLLAWSLDKRGETRIELAQQFQQIGNTQQANQIESQAIEDFNRSIENDDQRWQTFMHRGSLRAGKDEYEEAAADFSSVIDLNPTKTNAYFNRAELRYQLQQYDDAMVDYAQVLKETPKDLQALSGRANCLLAMNQSDEALRDYNRVVELSPSDAWAFANRADGFLFRSEWANAKADLEKAIQLRTNGELLRRLAWFLATCPDDAICNGERSLVLARRAVELLGESPECLDTLAAAYAAAGNFDRARDVYARAIALQETEDPSSRIKQTAYENNERYQEKFDR